MTPKSCFDTLLLSRDASLEDAKQSYKRLVKLWHPDQYGNSPEKQTIAQEKLKEINVAYREIVAYIEERPNRSNQQSVQVKPQQRNRSDPLKKQVKPSIWRRMALFIDSEVLKLFRNKKEKEDDFLGTSRTSGEGTPFMRGGSVPRPDFQQILNKAIRDRRAGLGVRKRKSAGFLKKSGHHAHTRKRGTRVYRTHHIPNRNPGDRIEKIKPIGRIKRVGD